VVSTSPPTPAISTLSLHDALPIYLERARGDRARGRSGGGRDARHDPATGPRNRHLRVGGLTDRAAQFRRGADRARGGGTGEIGRSEEHTSELQSRGQLVCRLLLEK